jgi:YHS domain-containing protein
LLRRVSDGSKNKLRIDRDLEESEMSDAVEEPTSQSVHDPVCHMDLPADEAAGSIEHDGFTYFFCSEACRDSFEADPEGVIATEAEHEHAAPASGG